MAWLPERTRLQWKDCGHDDGVGAHGEDCGNGYSHGACGDECGSGDGRRRGRGSDRTSKRNGRDPVERERPQRPRRAVAAVIADDVAATPIA